MSRHQPRKTLLRNLLKYRTVHMLFSAYLSGNWKMNIPPGDKTRLISLTPAWKNSAGSPTAPLHVIAISTAQRGSTSPDSFQVLCSTLSFMVNCCLSHSAWKHVRRLASRGHTLHIPGSSQGSFCLLACKRDKADREDFSLLECPVFLLFQHRQILAPARIAQRDNNSTARSKLSYQ